MKSITQRLADAEGLALEAFSLLKTLHKEIIGSPESVKPQKTRSSKRASRGRNVMIKGSVREEQIERALALQVGQSIELPKSDWPRSTPGNQLIHYGRKHGGKRFSQRKTYTTFLISRVA